MTKTTAPLRADFWPLPLHAAALVGPLTLLAIGTGIDRTGGATQVGTYLERIAAAPGIYLASGLLMIAGMAGLVATSAALVRLAAGMRRVAGRRANGYRPTLGTHASSHR